MGVGSTIHNFAIRPVSKCRISIDRSKVETHRSFSYDESISYVNGYTAHIRIDYYYDGDDDDDYYYLGCIFHDIILCHDYLREIVNKYTLLYDVYRLHYIEVREQESDLIHSKSFSWK